jgi:hypothetical protein
MGEHKFQYYLLSRHPILPNSNLEKKGSLQTIVFMSFFLLPNSAIMKATAESGAGKSFYLKREIIGEQIIRHTPLCKI